MKKKIFTVLCVLVLLVGVVSAEAGEGKLLEIKQELVSALKENRGMRVEKFTSDELKEFFAPAFHLQEMREKFLRLINSQLPLKRGDAISVVYSAEDLLYKGSSLRFEMEQCGYYNTIVVLSDGTVFLEEGISDEEARTIRGCCEQPVLRSFLPGSLRKR